MLLNAGISVPSLDGQNLEWTPGFVEYASLPAPLVKTEPENKRQDKSLIPFLKRVSLIIKSFCRHTQQLICGQYTENI